MAIDKGQIPFNGGSPGPGKGPPVVGGTLYRVRSVWGRWIVERRGRFFWSQIHEGTYDTRAEAKEEARRDKKMRDEMRTDPEEFYL